MKNTKVVLFDFDGVIADSLQTKLDVALKIILNMNVHVPNEYIHTAKDVVKNNGHLYLLKKIKFPIIKIPRLLSEINREQSKQVDAIPIVDGISDVLFKLSKIAILNILTANSEKYITPYLHLHEIAPYFNRIYSDSEEKGKDSVFDKFINENTVNLNNVYYIGDEVLDIKNSKRVGIKCVACSWGITSRNKLEIEKPYKIADKPSDIIKYII